MGTCGMCGKPSATNPGPICVHRTSAGVVYSNQVISKAKEEHREEVEVKSREIVKEALNDVISGGEADRIAWEKSIARNAAIDEKNRVKEIAKRRKETIKTAKRSTKKLIKITARCGKSFSVALLRAFGIPPFRGHKLVKKWIGLNKQKRKYPVVRQLALSAQAHKMHSDLATHPDSRVRANYFRAGKVKISELIPALTDQSSMVRATASKNPYLTPDQIDAAILSGKLSPREEKRLLMHNQCSGKLRVKALKEGLYGAKNGIGYVTTSMSNAEISAAAQHASYAAINRLLNHNGHLSTRQRLILKDARERRIRRMSKGTQLSA